MTLEKDLETALVSHQHEPGVHREAYCICGEPIGEYGKDLLTHVVAVLSAKVKGRISSVQSVLAIREQELINIKGPCTTPKCLLHFAHSGPCNIPKEGS